ncbi:acyltransferase family protein [Diaphorobacter aerolatus]|uniref:Acyltransferase n=1 Tax=Diaphorobacter aerolatus TaxID=1288495 RepID=A0A7H0GMB1_9BURK|nr:acyltransferase [Diaphorobacter aerolatus]QNP49427.1 acyltransferase [Diaphorobacter aerolatus]
MSSAKRNASIDCIKGLACMAIVWHHLAFYGPMSDVAKPLLPGTIEWLGDYARMAVQIFLVLGGYLAAASLAPQGLARFDNAPQQVGKRFVRLVVPYAVALIVAVLLSDLVRSLMDHPSVPGEPSIPQLIANAFLIQDIVGEEALSAGVWYVAIDFQLFVMAACFFAAMRTFKLSDRVRAAITKLLVIAGVCGSLLYANRHAEWDMWGIYFFGAYGLGMLAFWGSRSTRWTAWFVLIGVVGCAALWVDFRGRVALAMTSALLLMLLMRPAQADGTTHAQRLFGRLLESLDPLTSRLQTLGQMSYSVFLIHFSICLLVNAVVSAWVPDIPALHLLGMCLAFGLSLVAGRILYLKVERHVPTWLTALRWQLSLIGAGGGVLLAGQFVS